jgi:hypothetical protein
MTPGAAFFVAACVGGVVALILGSWIDGLLAEARMISKAATFPWNGCGSPDCQHCVTMGARAGGENVLATQKPSIGRTVHYQSFGTPGGEISSAPRAALITEVEPDGSTVGLFVANPTGCFFNRHVAFSESPKPGCWSWPPRVG